VRPGEFDAWRIEGIAHNTADLLERARIVDALDDALADVTWAVAFDGPAGDGARNGRYSARVRRPRPWAEHAADGPVAFVSDRGRTKGSSNDDLDRCQALVTIPTQPGHTSLNLAQAICVMAWESWMARTGGTVPEAAQAPGRRGHRRAVPAALHRLGPAMLDRIDFLKNRQPDIVMRSIRRGALPRRVRTAGGDPAPGHRPGVVRYLDRTAPKAPDRLTSDRPTVPTVPSPN